MIICVPIKRVMDYRVSAQVRSDADAILTAGVAHSMNPFDEIALERALQEKDAGRASIVRVIAIGNEKSDEVLRSALAMGADQAYRIHMEETPSPFLAAKLLAAFIGSHPCACVLTGKQAIDDDANQLGQLLAGFLAWSQGTFASELSFDEAGVVTVVREVDGGLETLACQLPAVITADLRLAEPRIPSLPAIMLSKGKAITLIQVSELGVSLSEKVSVSNYRPAPLRQGGRRIADVKELMRVLSEKGVKA